MNKEPDAKVPEYAKKRESKTTFAKFMNREPDAEVADFANGRRQSKLTFAKFMNNEPDVEILEMDGNQSERRKSKITFAKFMNREPDQDVKVYNLKSPGQFGRLQTRKTLNAGIVYK